MVFLNNENERICLLGIGPNSIHFVQKTFINTYCVPGSCWETDESDIVPTQEE